VNPLGIPVKGNFWSSDDVVLKRESHIVSVANLLRPGEWLSVSSSAQSEWTRQQGFGNVRLDSGDPNLPLKFTQVPGLDSIRPDEQKLSENFSLRFTKIPWTVLFAEGRFDQDSIGQTETGLPEAGTTADTIAPFCGTRTFQMFSGNSWRASRPRRGAGRP